MRVFHELGGEGKGRRGLHYLLLAITSLVLAPGKASAGDAVVVVGERAVDSAALTAEFARLPPPQLARLHRDDNAARLFAVRWYGDLLLEEEARGNGFLQRNPGVELEAAALARQVIGQAYFRDYVEQNYSTTEKELRQIYKIRKDKLCQVPARFRLANAGVLRGPKASPEERAASDARMNAIVSRVKAGEPFADVAEELSDLNGKLPGGEVGWLSEIEIAKSEGGADILALEVGGQTPVIEGTQRQAIYVLLEKSEARVLSFAECRRGLEQAQESQYGRELKLGLIDDLAERHQASMNLDAFIAAVRAAPVPKGWQQTWRPGER
jgi:hypothetical protein